MILKHLLAEAPGWRRDHRPARRRSDALVAEGTAIVRLGDLLLRAGVAGRIRGAAPAFSSWPYARRAAGPSRSSGISAGGWPAAVEAGHAQGAGDFPR